MISPERASLDYDYRELVYAKISELGPAERLSGLSLMPTCDVPGRSHLASEDYIASEEESAKSLPRCGVIYALARGRENETYPEVYICEYASDGNISSYVHVYETNEGNIMKRRIVRLYRQICFEDYAVSIRELDPEERQSLIVGLAEPLNDNLQLLSFLELSPSEERKIANHCRRKKSTASGGLIGERVRQAFMPRYDSRYDLG